jgi:hypothetical protein
VSKVIVVLKEMSHQVSKEMLEVPQRVSRVSQELADLVFRLVLMVSQEVSGVVLLEEPEV